MPVQPGPETISWDEAIERLAQGGDQAAAEERLGCAVADRVIGHYPPTAIPLRDRLDFRTGAWRVHANGTPNYLRVVRSDFERHFSLDNDQRKLAPSEGYMPGYLALIYRAIGEFNITDGNQPKAEVLRKWFETQLVEGEPISRNLAKALTTIVRRPDRKKGGAIPRRP
jgi:hypothetical protein